MDLQAVISQKVIKAAILILAVAILLAIASNKLEATIWHDALLFMSGLCAGILAFLIPVIAVTRLNKASEDNRDDPES